jgi:two-component system nitrogen regulation sensor histidine kinase NtrY
MHFEKRILLLSLAVSVPSGVVALALLAAADLDRQTRVAILIALVCTTFLLASLLRDRLSYPLRTISNVIAALREGDYTMRVRSGAGDDALGELMTEVNRLSETLREQRLDSAEAAALVRAIVAQLDSAIFAFGRDSKLQLINPAGEGLIGMTADKALGRTAAELGLRDCFETSLPAITERRFAGGSGRWSIRRSTFREKGKTHDLLVISDLSRALREEELQAWRRLVRVLGHELNNSLAPIKSVAEALGSVIQKEPLPDDWRDDARRGLAVISSRTEALARFTDAYTRLARMPEPVFGTVEVAALVRRVVALGFAGTVSIEPGPEAMVRGDAGQIEQALINLVQNGVDATREAGGRVVVGWRVKGEEVAITVRDEGPGLSGSLNLFVPFFTTKPGGTGIGLVLSRQIAEAHGGKISLESSSRGTGCEATLYIPLAGGAERSGRKH